MVSGEGGKSLSSRQLGPLEYRTLNPSGENVKLENTNTCDSGRDDGQQNGEHFTSADALVKLATALAKLAPEHLATLLAKLPDDERAAVEALAESVVGE